MNHPIINPNLTSPRSQHLKCYIISYMMESVTLYIFVPHS